MALGVDGDLSGDKIELSRSSQGGVGKDAKRSVHRSGIIRGFTHCQVSSTTIDDALVSVSSIIGRLTRRHNGAAEKRGERTLRLEGPRTGHALLDGQLKRRAENAGLVYALR
jgi:hypothetical protein